MQNDATKWLKTEVQNLGQMQKNAKPVWLPVLAATAIGLCLFTGYFTQHTGQGLMACTGALITLYTPAGNLRHKLTVLLFSTAGFVLAFSVGLFFGFNAWLSCLLLAVFTFVVHFTILRAQLKLPGSFLFIAMAAIAICMPHNTAFIAQKLTWLTSGCLLVCVLMIVLQLCRPDQSMPPAQTQTLPTNKFLQQAFILALFTGGSLAFAYALNLQKPYWVAISCGAVMQGTNLSHVWQRSFQRIAGTLAGLLVAWLTLLLSVNLFQVFCMVTILHLLAAVFIGRNYALAIACFTPIAIFLTEAGSGLHVDANELVLTRLVDTCIGSVAGIMGGWLLHNEWVRSRND